MMSNDSTLSYRPHNSGHDYHDRGIYLITLVVRGREKLLGRINDDLQQPGVELSTLGCMVQEEWEKTPAIQAQRGNRVRLLAPWNISQMGDIRKTLRDGTEIAIAADSDYSQFHNMNTLAAEICAFDGEAKVVGDRKS